MYIDHVNESTGVGSRFCLNADHADTAGSASKLDCGNVGNRTTPVYFANGVPQTCEQIKTETLTVNVNGANAGSFNGSQPVTINIDTISEDDVNALLNGYLPRSAGENYKLTGALGLPEGIMYGESLPETGFEGQLFFLAEDAENPPIYVPEGGHTGQVLKKNSAASGDISWGYPLPAGGEAGHVLIKNSATNNDASWKELVALPKGGTKGQIMVKSSTTDGDAAWVDGYASLTEAGLVSTGRQYFSGQKVFDQAPRIIIDNNKGSIPATTQSDFIAFVEPTGTSAVNRFGMIYTSIDTASNVRTGIHAYKNANASTDNAVIYVQYNADGTTKAYSSAPFYGAVWNDYAEFRAQKEIIEPGYCVASADNGQVYKTTEKFQACDGIVSDTFGFAIGETNECKTPLAVAGRVLAYCEGNRYDYHSGDTVCAGPDGKVCKMTREEIREWPDRIIGIVSEIPEYECWGDGNVPVNGRIWIKVK